MGFINVRDSPLYMYTIYKEMDNREKSAMGPGSNTHPKHFGQHAGFEINNKNGEPVVMNEY